MRSKWSGLICGLMLALATGASAEMTPKVLRVYGPGGPHHVLEECATLFREKHGVEVAVIRALPNELAQRLREDGDIYYGGAEYMLEEFARSNPGVLDATSVDKLHPRRIGIVVRKGNPLNIEGTEDLVREGVDLLDVRLENMRHFHGDRPGQGSNIRRRVFTGQQGVAAWRAAPEIDAWVTYKTWHVWLEDDSEFIEIPGDYALRFIPVAMTHRTPHRQEALQFISFLKSEEARRIFEKHGWD